MCNTVKTPYNNISRMLQFMFMLMIQCQLTSASSQIYYPPFTNLAFEKPVELSPNDAICGLSQASEFCESRTQKQNLCDKLSCHISCESGSQTSLPYNQQLLTIYSDTLPKDCGIQKTDFLTPSSSTSAIQFLSPNSSEPCHLSLQKSQLFTLKLQSEWSVTFTFWVWNDVEDGTTG